MTADDRSAHPNIAGVPWWGAALIAVTMTAVGFAYDAGTGDKELSAAFTECYVLGCIFAVLAVRQSGIFTAVIQPPLILFVAVPTAYFLFHGGHLGGVKDILINCGYPLIERFPLMFFTSIVVLVLGMVRWFLVKPGRQPKTASDAESTSGAGVVSAVTSKLSALFTGHPADQDDADIAETPGRRHTIDRPRRASKAAAASRGRGRPAKRTSPSRSRHTRPPETEIIERVVDRPRRTRTPRDPEQPPTPPAEPRRRPRPASSREPRNAVPPTDRRSGHERIERRRRYEEYQDYQPREPRVANGSGTHHPISRVRYRGEPEAEDHSEYRGRPRRPNAWQADSWEYDV